MKRRSSKPTNAASDFEDAVAALAAQRYVLRLYVTGMSPRSLRAITNAKALCENYLAGRYDLRVIDVYQEPALVAREQVVALPMLVKELPQPMRRIVGDLSDTNRTLDALNVQPRR
jgi:circadian clock protein KaiB